MSAPLLIPETPLQLLPTLAKAIGVNEALVVQQLHYWTLHTKDPDGWIYNTIEEWREQFPFLSKRTLERVWKSLGSKGIVEVEQRGGTDRTNHYRLLYDALPKAEIPSRQSGGMKPPKWRDEAAKVAGCLEHQQTTQQSSVVRQIFDFWVEKLEKGPGTKLSDKRRRRVESRLAEGFTERELGEAIVGCTLTPHNMGENDRGRPFNDLELICRDPEHVEDFRDTYRSSRKKKPAADPGAAANERRRRVRAEQGLDS